MVEPFPPRFRNSELLPRVGKVAQNNQRHVLFAHFAVKARPLPRAHLYRLRNDDGKRVDQNRQSLHAAPRFNGNIHKMGQRNVEIPQGRNRGNAHPQAGAPMTFLRCLRHDRQSNRKPMRPHNLGDVAAPQTTSGKDRRQRTGHGEHWPRRSQVPRGTHAR